MRAVWCSLALQASHELLARLAAESRRKARPERCQALVPRGRRLARAAALQGTRCVEANAGLLSAAGDCVAVPATMSSENCVPMIGMLFENRC